MLQLLLSASADAGAAVAAAAAAGAMSFEDGLKLVKLRGESMQAAADAAKSGMVSVIGLNKEKVAELCEAATKEVQGVGKGGGQRRWFHYCMPSGA